MENIKHCYIAIGLLHISNQEKKAAKFAVQVCGSEKSFAVAEVQEITANVTQTCGFAVADHPLLFCGICGCGIEFKFAEFLAQYAKQCSIIEHYLQIRLRDVRRSNIALLIPREFCQRHPVLMSWNFGMECCQKRTKSIFADEGAFTLARYNENLTSSTTCEWF